MSTRSGSRDFGLWRHTGRQPSLAKRGSRRGDCDRQRRGNSRACRRPPYRIVTVPLRITNAGEHYTEGVNISPPRVVAALLGGEKVVRSEPSAAEFALVYGRLADAGVKNIVSIHLSHRMHDAVANAEEAAVGARALVHVIDSGTVAMAQGFVALGRSGGRPRGRNPCRGRARRRSHAGWCAAHAHRVDDGFPVQGRSSAPRVEVILKRRQRASDAVCCRRRREDGGQGARHRRRTGARS